MRKRIKNTILFLLSILFIFYGTDFPLFSKEIHGEYTVIQPLAPQESGKSIEEKLYATKEDPGAVNNSTEILYSLAQVKQVASTYLNNRVTSFQIRYIGDTTDFKNKLSVTLNSIMNAQDYLALSILSWSVSYSGYEGDVNVTFSLKYVATKAEVEEADKKVKEIVASIIKPDMTEDAKEKTIHDYIITHVVYDNSLTYYSDYDALFRGTSVCQGYALLTYRMLYEAGITNRLVVGEANKIGHAWNLVYLRGNWYHVDCTWDDSVSTKEGELGYDYYNVTDEVMLKEHTWDKSLYPEATKTYDFRDQFNPEIILNSKPWKKSFSNYTEMPMLQGVPSDKKFLVTFTREVDTVGLANEKIALYDAATNQQILVSITIVEKNKVQVVPTTVLKYGKAYYLVVKDSTKGAYNEKIEKGIICPVIVEP